LRRRKVAGPYRPYWTAQYRKPILNITVGLLPI